MLNPNIDSANLDGKVMRFKLYVPGLHGLVTGGPLQGSLRTGGHIAMGELALFHNNIRAHCYCQPISFGPCRYRYSIHRLTCHSRRFQAGNYARYSRTISSACHPGIKMSIIACRQAELTANFTEIISMATS